MRPQKSYTSVPVIISNKFVIVAVIVIFLICGGPPVDGLWCYQCATTRSDSPSGGCIHDWEGMLNATVAKNGTQVTYVKDCTNSNPNWTRCMIERAQFEGTITLYHRGCHDGKTFAKNLDSPRFRNLRPNNFTTCAVNSVTNKLVCYTFCDTNFCNGPQPPEDICEWHALHPDTVTVPPGVNCSSTPIFPGHGPMQLQILALMITCLVFISSFF